MNGVDLVILVIIGFSAVFSLQRGFMLGMVDLFGLALAVIAGAKLAGLVAEPIRERGFSDRFAAGIGFLIATVVAYAVIGLAIRVLTAPLSAFGAGTPLGWFNSILGLIPGAIRGVALAAFLVIAMRMVPNEFGLQAQLASSQLAGPMAQMGAEALAFGLGWAGMDPAALGIPIGGSWPGDDVAHHGPALA
jgi:uncharacterized membrane protein required for colicin V production